MEALVRRMAKRLASRYARKRHRAHRGYLDVRKTIRKSMGYGGVPFNIVWKTETIEKPKIVAICDVSRSVAAAAQFMLLFLYSLNEVIEKLEAFAFSDRLIRVGDILEGEDLDSAIASIIKKIGMRPTDYGRALVDFTELHRADKGKLDVRKTIRRSMGYGGVPFEVVWKTETIEKPKIVAICDVSRSVAAAAQFMLLFLYSLNEVIDKLEAFAFSDRLIRVGDILEAEELDAAIASIIKKIGMRPTDYGRALVDFTELHRDALDRHTTVIILGDGRSNYSNPRLDIMREISHRARAVIWLNPEPLTYWGQGDSRMDQYQRFCNVAKVCNTLNQLERIIEDVLRTYMPR